MTGSIQEKHSKLYAVLCYKDVLGKPQRKWVPTNLEVRGNKKRAEFMLPGIIEEHLYLEPQECKSVLFVDYIREWLIRKKADVQLSTWEGYEIYVTRHIIPYFEPLGLIYVTLYYGLRRSEVLGLKWDAVDFESDTLKIQHTVVKQKTIIAKDSTKSMTSRRVYPLLKEVKKLLLELREKQKRTESISVLPTRKRIIFLSGATASPTARITSPARSRRFSHSMDCRRCVSTIFVTARRVSSTTTDGS